jgi:antitoxin component YwqK of YwqJK toxin-antitoxin module
MGLLHGCQIKYDRKGNKQLAISYFEGKKHNTWTYYFDNQEIARKEEWDKGIKEGDFITYNSSGLIISEQHFKKGIPVGIHKEFYQDGREKNIKFYSKKGRIEEEHAFDDYGVKTTIIQRETKAMKKKKRKGQKEDNSLMN